MSVVGDLRSLAVHPGFRKLFTVRLVSQCGDGLFQVGLATLFFFSPQTMATASGVAAAFAVLLLPFTVVGPFAGPLLDRWRRRQTLLWGNAVRMVLGLVLAGVMAVSGVGPAVYVLALATLGVNRFLLAALSAGLPHVVPGREKLVMANAITPTLGAVSAVVGAGVGLVLRWLLPAGRVADAGALVLAAVFFAAASVLALRLAKDELGPDRRATAPLTDELRATAVEMVDGGRYLLRRGTPGLALGLMAMHRFLYGVNFLALILISRNLLSDPADADAGLATFGVLSGVSFLGNGLAIVLTPLATQRVRPAAWATACVVLGAVSQLLMTTTPRYAVVAVAAVLLGLSVQGAKIAVDTIVQRDTADSYRGRAFTLYDALYNSAFVGAAALAAVALPDTGWSRAVFVPLTLAYVLLAIWYRAGTHRIADTPRPVLAGER